MTVEIETSTTDYYWVQTTALDGTDYVLSFRYNSRENAYYLQISDTGGDVLLSGVKLVTNFPLFRSVTDSRLPRGELYALTSTNDDSTAAFGELGRGQRVTLVYVSEAELVAAGKEPWRFPGFLT